MAKLRPTPLTSADIDCALATSSDFAFEMETLSLLDSLQVLTEHAGTYLDPLTEKARQFDIRAHKQAGSLAEFRLAVECKNIGAHHPLAAHVVPRRPTEAFHSVLCYCSAREGIAGLQQIARLEQLQSVYQTGQLVGKALDQVGFTPSGDPTLGDSDVYDKYAQAINSLRDLVSLGAYDLRPTNQVFVPILVVPNGRLWRVPYNEAGLRTSAAEQSDRVSVYIGRDWPCGTYRIYTVSHLEVVTTSGLRALVTELSNPSSAWYWSAPKPEAN